MQCVKYLEIQPIRQLEDFGLVKLSLIEPFALRPATEEGADAEVEEIAKNKRPLSGVDTHLGGDSLTDSSEEEVSRGFTRFIDFLAKQKERKFKHKHITRRMREGLRFYQKLQRSEFSETYLGHHTDHKV